MWGTVAIMCIDMLFFFSLAIWRLRAYNVFYVSHIAAFILFLVAVCHMVMSNESERRVLMTLPGLPAHARRDSLGACRRRDLPWRPRATLPQNAALHRAPYTTPRALRDDGRGSRARRWLARGPARPPARAFAAYGLVRLGGDTSVHDRECERCGRAAGLGGVVQEYGPLDEAA